MGADVPTGRRQPHGRLLGVVTSRDYRISRMSPDDKVSTFMTPFEKLIEALKGYVKNAERKAGAADG